MVMKTRGDAFVKTSGTAIFVIYAMRLTSPSARGLVSRAAMATVIHTTATCASSIVSLRTPFEEIARPTDQSVVRISQGPTVHSRVQIAVPIRYVRRLAAVHSVFVQTSIIIFRHVT